MGTFGTKSNKVTPLIVIRQINDPAALINIREIIHHTDIKTYN